MASQALEGYEESASEDDEAYGRQAEGGPTYVEEQQQLRQAFLQVPASSLHSFDNRIYLAPALSLHSSDDSTSLALHLVHRIGWLWQCGCSLTPACQHVGCGVLRCCRRKSRSKSNVITF